MKRQEVEKLINPTEHNKHWYSEEGWEYLTTMATSLEKVMQLCKENGLEKELNDIMDITEDDYNYRLYEIYHHIKEKNDGENLF